MENIGDILLYGGKVYVSMNMYKSLQEDLMRANELSENFLSRLTSIEIANENRKKVKVLTLNNK